MDKDIEYENKLDGLKSRTNETDEYIEGIEDQFLYLEDQSRRNNVKIMGVDEDLEEKTWDDTEKIVRKLIRSALKRKSPLNVPIELEKDSASRHPGLMGQRSMIDPGPSL